MKPINSDAEAMKKIAGRSRARKARMATHKSHSFEEAEAWDLAYWQSAGPEARLSALVALHNDWRMIEQARGKGSGNRI